MPQAERASELRLLSASPVIIARRVMFFVAVVAGQGTQAMSEADQAALNDWVRTVHARIWNAAALANLPSTALANCPAERDGAKQVVDARHGFCLLIPAAYTVFNPNTNEIVIAKDSLLNVTEPRLSIAVTSAGARTAEQAADDIVAAMPGFDPN